jgi:hypothetical protein
MAAKYDLKPIDPNEVEFSKDNPRGEREEEILKDPEFEQLKDSVYKYGVLVPIVVHRQRGKPKPYYLVDGERRLRAARLTGTKTIPAHIAPGDSSLDDLVQAFHIHMLRKQWRPLAMTRALKKIIEELRKGGCRSNEDQLLDELQERTGCTPKQLKDLRRAIRFPDSALAAVDKGQFAWSHLVQIEESLIEPLAVAFPGILNDVPRKQIRQVMVDKAARRVLTDTRALMNNVVPVLNRVKQEGPAVRNYAEQLLRAFVTDPNMPAEDVLKRFERQFPDSRTDCVDIGRSIAERCDVLVGLLKTLPIRALADFPKLSKEVLAGLEELQTVVARTVRQMKRH